MNKPVTVGFASILLCSALVGCPKDPKREAADRELHAFAAKVTDFQRQTGKWPATLVAVVGKDCPTGRPECMSREAFRLDPWGQKYEYDQSARGALLRSAGPDGQLGTRDDLEVAVAVPGGASK